MSVRTEVPIIILRGGKKPNYDKSALTDCVSQLEGSDVNPNIMVDFSHGNSMKKHENQKKVCLDICKQLKDGNKNIVGAMIESHLKSGNQKISEDMEYGRSVTDACIDFEETKNLLTALSDAVKERRKIE